MLMIDYDKLNIAHELAHKSRPKDGCITIDLAYNIGSDGQLKPYFNIFTEDRDGMTEEHEFYHVDDLIEKLIKLTHTEPKYKIGDKVWYIDLPINKIHSSIIVKVNDDEYAIDGSINGTKNDFIESELYPTKQTLIKAQIAYWTDMDEHVECQHESDTLCYTTFDPPKNKCIKCGEFYR